MTTRYIKETETLVHDLECFNCGKIFTITSDERYEWFCSEPNEDGIIYCPHCGYTLYYYSYNCSMCYRDMDDCDCGKHYR